MNFRIPRLTALFLSVAIALGSLSATAATPLRVVFVGNSISFGAGLNDRLNEAPPSKAIEHIRRAGYDDVSFINCGVCGATTVDYLPVARRLFPNVTAAADSLSTPGAQLIFSISLGTNDSACSGPLGAPVLPAQYYTNMQVIADSLLEAYPGCRVVLQYPIWYSPNTYNGAVYLAEGLARLESYFPMIEKLAEHYASAAPGRVSTGSRDAFAVFRDHATEYLAPEEGNAGTFLLHPNSPGAALLGGIWGDAILNTLSR